jgi:DNA-binding LacI/PurR family transcriptional regulator
VPRSPQPTSRDVAKLAGVSVATVSFVMNGRDERRVSAETRERVLDAARALAYAPNQSARSLRRQRTERVALVVGSIGVPAYDQLTRDLHTAADDAGHGVLTLVVDSARRADKAVELLHQRIADGALVAASVPHLPTGILAELARSGLPLVVMRNDAAPEGFDVVRAPEVAACAEALDHLFRDGRRRVAFLGHAHEVGPVPRQDAVPEDDFAALSERRRAYVEALQRHGVPVTDQLVVPGADDRVAGYQAASALLALPRPPDAIFAASDRAAISVMNAVRDAGLTVPGDVAVVGVGNLAEGLITRPALSTVGPATQDYTQVARLLFERVLTPEPLPGRTIDDPWTFIRRAST